MLSVTTPIVNHPSSVPEARALNNPTRQCGDDPDINNQPSVPEARALNNPTRQCGDDPDINNQPSVPEARALSNPTTMSYIQSIYHIVFRTYKSEPTICADHEKELYALIMKQTETLRAKLIRIGGMPDHIHILVSLPPDLSVAKYVQAIKTFTSKWLHENSDFPKWNGWGREYAAISYGIRDKEMIANYIRNQKEHHKIVSFAEEYRSFLLENGITIKEEYFLKD